MSPSATSSRRFWPPAQLLHRARREAREVERLDELVGALRGGGARHAVERALAEQLVAGALREAAARELPDVADARAHLGRAA